MKPHYKTAGEALFYASTGDLEDWGDQNDSSKSQYEQIAQAFLASEWGESEPEPFCSECARSGHKTADCPFPRTAPLFPDLEANAETSQP